MSTYYFNLRDGGAGVLDIEGTELPDLSAARTYAVEIARELLRPNEIHKRPWQLDVYDSEAERCSCCRSRRSTLPSIISNRDCGS